MAAMYDLTHLTGARAERARSTFFWTFQIPAAWVAPITGGVIAGTILGLAAWPLTGPAALLPALLITPALAVWLLVDDVEPPWRRAMRRARNHDGQFIANGEPVDTEPPRFVHVAPSSTPYRPTKKGAHQ